MTLASGISTDARFSPVDAYRLPQNSSILTTDLDRYVGSVWRCTTAIKFNQLLTSTLVASAVQTFQYAVYQDPTGKVPNAGGIPRIAFWTHSQIGTGDFITDLGFEVNLVRGSFFLLYGRDTTDSGDSMRVSSWGARDMRLQSNTLGIVGLAPSSFIAGPLVTATPPATFDPTAQPGAGSTAANDLRMPAFRFRFFTQQDVIADGEDVIADGDIVVAGS